jgi:hypothetical protein
MGDVSEKRGSVSVAPWSFSRIKAFEQCPKQFYHEKILKEFPVVETEAMRYGTDFHLAAEEYIRDNTELPKKFSFAKDMLDSLVSKTGEKLCEQKFGITESLEPCDFFSEHVWFRGIADLVILNESSAWVIDYKTGKSAKYADKGQLELMALALFAHYPNITHVRAGLVFVVCNVLIKDEYADFDKPKLWEKWLSKYKTMEIAAANDVWNPKPSGLCRRHCPVTVCVHNGGY